MKNAIQFFQDENGFMSMSRLLMFGSFVITSILMLQIPMSEGYFGIYIGTYAGSYLGGKAMDIKMANSIGKGDPAP